MPAAPCAEAPGPRQRPYSAAVAAAALASALRPLPCGCCSAASYRDMLLQVVDGAVAPGGEAAAARRRKMALITGATAGPLASAAVAAALAAEGAELLQACGAAAPLLLSLYFHTEKRIFALLTDDSNFFVLGVRRPHPTSARCSPSHVLPAGDTRAAGYSCTVLLLSRPGRRRCPRPPQVERIASLVDVCCGPDAVDFSIWTASTAWRDWRAAWLAGAGPPSLKQRAQAAALLGGDFPEAARRRAAAKGASPVLPPAVASPVLAAQLCLQARAPSCSAFFSTPSLPTAAPLPCSASSSAAALRCASGLAWARVRSAKLGPWPDTGLRLGLLRSAALTTTLRHRSSLKHWACPRLLPTSWRLSPPS